MGRGGRSHERKEQIRPEDLLPRQRFHNVRGAFRLRRGGAARLGKVDNRTARRGRRPPPEKLQEGGQLLLRALPRPKGCGVCPSDSEFCCLVARLNVLDPHLRRVPSLQGMPPSGIAPVGGIPPFPLCRIYSDQRNIGVNYA